MSKGPPPETMARYLRWGILLFLGYVLLHAMNIFGIAKPRAPVATPTAATQSRIPEKNCDDVNPLKNFSLLAIPLLPEFTASLPVEETTPGEGAAAACGQNATLRYEYLTQNGAVLFSDMESSHKADTVRIGDGQLLRGVELNLQGMKPGGTRKMRIPPALAFGGLKDINGLADHEAFTIPKTMALGREPILARVSLLSLSPALPASQQPLRIINTAFGNGEALQCGDSATVHMTIWKLDGTQIFTTTEGAPLTFQLGMSQVPYGVEQALQGMRVGGMRTVILPPAYATLLNPAANATPLFPTEVLSGNETVLVEISLMPPQTQTVKPATLTTH